MPCRQAAAGLNALARLKRICLAVSFSMRIMATSILLLRHGATG